MGKPKNFEIHVPIQGEIKVLKTDLICNSCGKQLENGEYLYFCGKCEDDLCSGYNCLKSHAGHGFFRWGRLEMGASINQMIRDRPAPPKKGDHPPPIKINTIGVPMAPPAFPPPPSLPGAAPSTEGPTIKTGPLSALRTEMLKELKCLYTKRVELDDE